MPKCSYCNSTIPFGGIRAGNHRFCNRNCQQAAALGHVAHFTSARSLRVTDIIGADHLITKFVMWLLKRESLAEVAVLLPCAFVVSMMAASLPYEAFITSFNTRYNGIIVVAICIAFLVTWIRVGYLVAKMGRGMVFNSSQAPIFGLCVMFFSYGICLSGAPASHGKEFIAAWAVIALSAAAVFTLSYLVLILLLRKKLHASVWIGSFALFAGTAKMLYDIASAHFH